VRGFLGCVLVRAGANRRAIQELDAVATSFAADEISPIRARVLYALAVALRREKVRLAEAAEHLVVSRNMFCLLDLLDELRDAESEAHALAMMILMLVSIPIFLLSVVNEIAALLVVSGANFLSVFDLGQLNALAYIFMRLHSRTNLVAYIVGAFWFFPFGILVIRSDFIPRFLGYLLFIAAFGYLASSFTSLVLPSYRHLVDQFAMVLTIAELPIIFWLLIWGAKDQPSDKQAPDPALA